MVSQLSLSQELEGWDELVRLHPDKPEAYVRRGMTHFKLAHIEESIRDFNQAEQLNPAIAPYLWQRGLSFYYANRFEDGARQFEVDLQVNAQDVEETVWRYLCIARAQGMEEAQRTLLAVKNDPRPIMRHVYDLYAGHCLPEDVLVAGEKDGVRGLFYAHLYVGLYYEAANEATQAKHYIWKAANDYAIADYMWHLTMVHTALRRMALT